MSRYMLNIGQEVRRYGYFRCPQCGNGWESGRTYCQFKGGLTFEPTSTQACKRCDIMTLPHTTKPLERPSFDEVRHVDENKAHRSDLCSRCRSGQHCSSGARF